MRFRLQEQVSWLGAFCAALGLSVGVLLNLNRYMLLNYVPAFAAGRSVEPLLVARAQHAPTPQRPRALVTDMFFPNALAAWRLNSVSAMQDHFDADVLVVMHIDPYSFDWLALNASHRLHDYDLLIFNPKYNHLDWVNALNRGGATPFNGTAWNGRAPSDYLLRLRKIADEETFDVSAYDVYYHIFVNMYTYFTGSFPAAQPERSWIHFYPGGGFVWHPSSMWN